MIQTKRNHLHHHQQDDWRFCRLCKQRTKRFSKNSHNNRRYLQWIIPCDCYPGFNHVHRKCQMQLMLTQSRIHCERCGCQFRGLSYRFTNKDWFDFVWNDETSRNELLNHLSILCSTIVCVGSLWSLFRWEFNDFLNEIIDLDWWSFDMDSIRNCTNIFMQIHLKLLLPIVSIIHGCRQSWIVWNNYQNYIRKNFHIHFDNTNDSHQQQRQQNQQHSNIVTSNLNKAIDPIRQRLSSKSLVISLSSKKNNPKIVTITKSSCPKSTTISTGASHSSNENDNAQKHSDKMFIPKSAIFKQPNEIDDGNEK